MVLLLFSPPYFRRCVVLTLGSTILAYLVKNKRRVLEFRQILENVWGFEYTDDVDYLRVYIWHLRRKLEPDPKTPIYFLNELNVGYRFEPQT